MLRTRSPLGLHRCCHRVDPVRLACIRHAASVRPEPGSNSPSRSRSDPAPFGTASPLRSFEEPAWGLTPLADWHQKRSLLSVISAIDICDHGPRTRRSPRSPALAFGCSYSVLKERRRDTLPYGRRCLCALRDRHVRASLRRTPVPHRYRPAILVAFRSPHQGALPSEAESHLSTATLPVKLAGAGGGPFRTFPPPGACGVPAAVRGSP
ncbi:MAG: hypothetical protein JWO62_1483 [Acidimicrobiaceae bacterium]|nr:hypothetical protein [Acidimicrobiaceae bacterium]